MLLALIIGNVLVTKHDLDKPYSDKTVRDHNMVKLYDFRNEYKKLMI